MAEALYETLFPEISVHAPNCPEPALVNAIRNACVDFCTETLYLTEDMDPISLTADEAVYEIDTKPGYDVVQLAGPLYFNGRKLELKSPQELNGIFGTSWREKTGPEPVGYVQYRPNEIILVPVPTAAAADALTARVAFTPSRTSTRVNSDLLSDFRTELAAGALSRILMIPDQPYTDVKKALTYAKLFGAAIANAKSTVRSSFSRAQMRVHYNRFW